MVLLNKIKDFALFAGFTREQYSQASELFPESNRKLLMALSFLLGTVVLALALAAIFWESRGVMVSSLAYIAFSVLNYGMFFISYKFGVSFPKVILPFCYVVLISCYILAIYAGCAHGPRGLAVAMAAMVVVLPIFFYDLPLRMIGLNIVGTGAFLVCSHHVKDYEIFLADVVDVVPFAVAGCMLCYVINRTKVNDLHQRKELAKQSAKIDELNFSLIARNSELETSLEHERLNSSVIRCLGNPFYALYLFDLEKKNFKEIKSTEAIRNLVGVEGDARQGFYLLTEKTVSAEDKAAISRFTDIDTMQERLRGKNTITEEFLGVFSGWSRALIIPLTLNEFGDTVEALFCARSINDEKQALLRQEHLQKLNESIKSGMWNVDFDEAGEVVSCYRSEAYRKMMGYSSIDEFPNTLDAWSERLHPEDRDIILNSFWTAVYDRSDRIVYDVEYRAKMKNGVYHWFHAAGRVTRRKNGSPISMIGVFIDINNQKEMELQLEQQQATLRDAFVTAQQASAAKSAFLNNMSHDIRTPLNAILGFSSLASTHLDEREQLKGYISKISTAGRHLLELVNDVLDMSRIESGKVKIDEAPASISAMIREIETIVNESSKEKSLTLIFDTSEVINDSVSCDKLRLNQVLLNLMGNAIKFSHDGGHVSLRVKQKGAAVDQSAAYELVVEDDGIGMSEEFQKHVFEPFEREKTSTVSGIQGTGLGLAICKNIVNMMGGTISVQSESGKGTKFTVSLSFKIEETVVVEEPDVKIENLAPKSFKGLKVLLVEDNELNAEIAQSILQEAGFVVDTVGDGSVAVERIRTAELGQYDVILMDVQMPVMDGYEATRQIRAMHRSGISSLPIIAVTANAFEEDRLQALQAGMDGHVGKPIEIPKLLKTLESVLR
ncbi:MAG: ATP-binding protein [Fibrobacter sp.]|nr:ATP-binding protein [Fibrobacter sp.]